MMNLRDTLLMMPFVPLLGVTSGCAQLLGIEDLPTFEDSGAQPQDSGAQPQDSGAQPQIDASIPAGPDAGPSNQRRKQIAIDPSRVQAPAAPGFLADFPVLFSVVDPDITARASLDGSDIYFVAADGVSRLDHEIEKWSPDTGELVAFVKIPALSAMLETVFYVVYGDPSQAQPANPSDVWSSNFVAVWHLSQDPGPGTQGGMTDSTTGNDGTAHGSMVADDRVAGQIGSAIDFDGLDDEITFLNPLSGNTTHTISAWVRQEGTGSNDTLMVLGNGAINQARFLNTVFSGGSVGCGFYANDHTTSLDIRDDGWTLLHWTYDGTRSRLYANGAQQGATVTVASGVDTQGSEGRIGNAAPEFGTNLNLNGVVDEVRIATVARPVEWIATEFNNQSSPSTFYTVGPETE